MAHNTYVSVLKSKIIVENIVIQKKNNSMKTGYLPIYNFFENFILQIMKHLFIY